MSYFQNKNVCDVYMSELTFTMGLILAIGPIPSVIYIILCVLSLVLLVMGSKYTHKGFCSKEKCSKEKWAAAVLLLFCWISFFVCMGYSIERLITFFLGRKSSDEESSGEEISKIIDPLHVVALISCVLFFILWIIGITMYNKIEGYKKIFYGAYLFIFFIALFASFCSSCIVLDTLRIINSQS